MDNSVQLRTNKKGFHQWKALFLDKPYGGDRYAILFNNQ